MNPIAYDQIYHLSLENVNQFQEDKRKKEIYFLCNKKDEGDYNGT